MRRLEQGLGSGAGSGPRLGCGLGLGGEGVTCAVTYTPSATPPLVGRLRLLRRARATMPTQHTTVATVSAAPHRMAAAVVSRRMGSCPGWSRGPTSGSVRMAQAMQKVPTCAIVGVAVARGGGREDLRGSPSAHLLRLGKVRHAQHQPHDHEVGQQLRDHHSGHGDGDGAEP